MCFYNDDYDCDWTVSVEEEHDLESGPECKCDECRRVILATEPRHTIHQQEHEGCQICEDDCSEHFISPDEIADELAEDGDPQRAAMLQKELDEHEHFYGQSFDYVRCMGCDKLLMAIEKAEEEAGCPVDARRPMLTELWENMREVHDARHYAEKAVAMFPELADHPIVSETLERPATVAR